MSSLAFWRTTNWADQHRVAMLRQDRRRRSRQTRIRCRDRRRASWPRNRHRRARALDRGASPAAYVVHDVRGVEVVERPDHLAGGQAGLYVDSLQRSAFRNRCLGSGHRAGDSSLGVVTTILPDRGSTGSSSAPDSGIARTANSPASAAAAAVAAVSPQLFDKVGDRLRAAVIGDDGREVRPAARRTAVRRGPGPIRRSRPRSSVWALVTTS